jgi:hypothetical protein
VFLLHETSEPTGLFAAELSSLKKHVRLWSGCSDWDGRKIEEPLALFPQSILTRICELKDLNLEPPKAA